MDAGPIEELQGILRQLLHQSTTGHQLNVLNSERLLERVAVHRSARLAAMPGGLEGFVAQQQRRTEELAPAVATWVACLHDRTDVARDSERASSERTVALWTRGKHGKFPTGNWECVSTVPSSECQSGPSPLPDAPLCPLASGTAASPSGALTPCNSQVQGATLRGSVWDASFAVPPHLRQMDDEDDYADILPSEGEAGSGSSTGEAGGGEAGTDEGGGGSSSNDEPHDGLEEASASLASIGA